MDKRPEVRVVTLDADELRRIVEETVERVLDRRLDEQSRRIERIISANKHIDLKEAEKLMGIKRDTIIDLIEARHFSKVKHVGKWVLKLDEVLEYMERITMRRKRR